MKKQLTTERQRLLRLLEKLLEGPMVFLGLIWLVLIVIEIVWGLPAVLEYTSFIIWGIFIVDFLVKFLLAPEKLIFLRKNLLTAISLIIPAFRIFRMLRVFRLLRGVRVVRIVASLNRSMKSLGFAMKRRGFGYVAGVTVLVMFGGAAGMLAIEKGNPGFENYGMALWWTAMRLITAGSDYWPLTVEGRVLAFILAVFGYAVFGYVTATLATFFIGRDAEEKNAPIAGAGELDEVKRLIIQISAQLDELRKQEDRFRPS